MSLLPPVSAHPPPRQSESGPRNQLRFEYFSSPSRRLATRRDTPTRHPRLCSDAAPTPPHFHRQASDAAANWATKRKQALERATELRAARKAAERASANAIQAPPRAYDNDPLPQVRSDDAADPSFWQVSEGPAPPAPTDGARPRRQWGDAAPLAPHPAAHPGTPSPIAESRDGRVLTTPRHRMPSYQPRSKSGV